MGVHQELDVLFQRSLPIRNPQIHLLHGTDSNRMPSITVISGHSSKEEHYLNNKYKITAKMTVPLVINVFMSLGFICFASLTK